MKFIRKLKKLLLLMRKFHFACKWTVNNLLINSSSPILLVSQPYSTEISNDELTKTCNAVGDGVTAQDVTIWGGKSSSHLGVVLGDNVALYPGCRLVVDLISPESGIVIENGVAINLNSYIEGSGGVHIGEKTLIGPGVVILSSSHGTSPINGGLKSKKYKKTIIGKEVWLGANSVILMGINIGDRSMIGAGSVVTKDVPANTMVAGQAASPKKIISGNLSKSSE